MPRIGAGFIDKLPVNSYTRCSSAANGIRMIEWDSMKECSKHFKIEIGLIKKMIYLGGSYDGKTTFEIPTWASYDIVEDQSISSDGKRIKVYRIVK